MRKELEPKCVPQLPLRSLLVTCLSAIAQFFLPVPVALPEVFAKANSAQIPSRFFSGELELWECKFLSRRENWSTRKIGNLEVVHDTRMTLEWCCLELYRGTVWETNSRMANERSDSIPITVPRYNSIRHWPRR